MNNIKIHYFDERELLVRIEIETKAPNHQTSSHQT